MADAYVVAVFKAEGRVAADLFKKVPPNQDLRSLSGFVEAVQGGVLAIVGGFAAVDDTGTEPQGTITVTAASIVVGESVTFGFMGGLKSLVAGTDFQFDITDDDATAAALAAAINSKIPLVRATVAANVITVTGLFPGPLLESIEMTTDNGTAFVFAQMGATTTGVDATDAPEFFQGRVHSGYAANHP